MITVLVVIMCYIILAYPNNFVEIFVTMYSCKNKTKNSRFSRAAYAFMYTRYL